MAKGSKQVLPYVHMPECRGYDFRGNLEDLLTVLKLSIFWE